MRGSDFYGIQRIFNAYAKAPHLGFFPYSVQHGWQQTPTRFEADGDPVEIWVWSHRIKGEIGKFFDPDRVRVVGSPYLYLDKLSAKPAPLPGRALYMLPHSSHFSKTGFSLDHLQELLTSVADENGACDVLVYYLDVRPELCAALRRSCSRILISGGLWSSDFLYRFRSNILPYRRLYYSTFGSGICFAQYEGLETIHIPLDSYLHQSENLYVNALAAKVAFDHRGQAWHFAEELGVGSMLGAEEMRLLIRRGISENSAVDIQRRLLGNLKNTVLDYFGHVRPAMRAVERHNLQVAKLAAR